MLQFFLISILSFKGIYECPGGTILRAAHLDIETFTMDRVSCERPEFIKWMHANIKPCRVVWEMTCKRFSLLLYGRNCAKSSRCWRASFQSRFTMDIGTVLKGIMCVSVWTRVKITWREKWHWIFSKEMYVFSILLQFSWNSVGA